MNPDIERLCRAAIRRVDEEEHTPCYNFGEGNYRNVRIDGDWDVEGMIRDILTEARVPSEGMVGAVWNTDDLVFERADGTKWIRWEDVIFVYRIMIDHLLRDSDEQD